MPDRGTRPSAPDATHAPHDGSGAGNGRLRAAVVRPVPTPTPAARGPRPVGRCEPGLGIGNLWDLTERLHIDLERTSSSACRP